MKIFKSNHSKNIFLLIILSYAVLMMGNGLVALTHPDEVFYAQTAKEMFERNEWLTPYIFDQPQFEKPVLFYWLIIPALKIFGMTSFAARFWPAFFGILGVVVTYWISWMMFGNKRTSFLSACILCSSFIYVALSRAVITDIVFSTWVITSIGFFYLAYQKRKYKTSGIILMSAFAGIAVLTKGLLGLCFPLAVIAIYLLMRKDMSFLKTPAVLWGMLVFLIIALPWHLWMYHAHGQSFIDEYFHNVHVRRLFDAEHQKCDTWYFYFMTMIGGVFPWTFYVIPAVALAVKQVRNKYVQSPPLMFLFAWVIGVYIFVQPAKSKLASYIFPAIPAIAVLVAYYISNVTEPTKKLSIRGIKWASIVLGVFLLLAAGLLVSFSRRHVDIVVNMAPIYIFSVLLVFIALAIMLFLRKEQYSKIVYVVPLTTVCMIFFLLSGKFYAEPWVSCKEICDRLKKIDQSDSTLLASKFYVRGVRYFTGRDVAVMDICGREFFSPHPIPFLISDDQVMVFLAEQPGDVYGVVKISTFKDLERIMGNSPYQMTCLDYVGEKYIVKIEKEGGNKQEI
ncbi:MAG: glycosyltransferase family 39 protein [Candidatus Omnitrophica bacterium]|nr:glycosyltransferase family 39 protein [Candidatus Omnitrophota bacterium]